MTKKIITREQVEHIYDQGYPQDIKLFFSSLPDYKEPVRCVECKDWLVSDRRASKPCIILGITAEPDFGCIHGERK